MSLVVVVSVVAVMLAVAVVRGCEVVFSSPKSGGNPSVASCSTLSSVNQLKSSA